MIITINETKTYDVCINGVSYLIKSKLIYDHYDKLCQQLYIDDNTMMLLSIDNSEYKNLNTFINMITCNKTIEPLLG